MSRPGWHAKSDAPASIQAIARSRLQSEEAAINGNSNYAHSKVFSRPKAQNCLVGARVLEPTKMRLKRSSNLRRLSSGIQYTRSITTPTSPNRVKKPEVPSGERSMRHQTSSHLSYVSKTGIYHDTGSTPISFFKDQPDNFQATPGSVQTADDSSSQSTGTGTIQFGNMTIPVVHVPSFNKNLASGIWIMTAGYYQEIYNNKLLVRTRPGGAIIATGTYNPSVGLLEMDAIVSLPLTDWNAHPQSSMPPKLPPLTASTAIEISWNDLHCAMGHPGATMLARSLKAVDGVSDRLRPPSSWICEPCLLNKQNRHARIKNGSSPTVVLDLVEMDSQGPFPLVAADGSNGNIKIIDAFSGYCHMTTTYNCSSADSTALLKSFQLKLERRTGLRLKRVRTDGGSEFLGDFNQYVSAHGLINEQGNPYEHEIPGRCERLHQTVLKMGRAILHASRLPLRFYCYAQKYAVYMLNRLVHSGHSKTPYEYIYGTKPNLAHIRPFGSVCYVQIPADTRNKLAPTSERCRLLGYGDTDDTIEHKGYLLLREHDLSTFYSRSVRFEYKAPLLPLPNEDDPDEPGDSTFLDPTYVPEYADDDSEHESFVSSPAENTTPGIIANTDDSLSEEYFSAISESGGDDNDTVDSEGSIEPYAGHIAKVEEIIQENSRFLPVPIHQSYLALTEKWPQTLPEAQASNEWPEWNNAINVEMNALIKNGTWICKEMPKNKKSVKCKWVFTKKYDRNGDVKKYKARLVAKGFTQKYGTDYTETFAPVVMFKSVRTLVAICASLGLKAYQDDVPSAFLRGNLKEEIFMEPPRGMQTSKPQDKCYLLKTLYGLKQSPKEWNQVLHDFLISERFCQSKCDPCLYFRGSGTSIVLVAVYVDDIITAGNDATIVSQFRESMHKKFGMDSGDILEWYLGICFNFEETQITLDQKLYIRNKIELFDKFIGQGTESRPMPENTQKALTEESPPAAKTFPYRSMVGSLIYAMLGTRPDLAFAVSILSRHLDNPNEIHVELLRHVFRYLRKNISLGLIYKRGAPIVVSGYVDAAYANHSDYRSTSGYGLTVGSSLVSWYSKRQSVVAQSSAESEYYAAVDAANEAVWFKRLLTELGFSQGCITLYEDNQACIALSKNPEDHKRTKHIQVKYHVLRDYVKNKLIKLEYIASKYQLADLFTKSLPSFKLRPILSSLGVSAVGGELNHGRKKQG
jgi:hypothetical protein